MHIPFFIIPENLLVIQTMFIYNYILIIPRIPDKYNIKFYVKW